MSNPQSSTGHRKQVSSGKIQNEKSNQNKLENNGQNNNNNNLNNNLNNNNSLLNSKDIQNFAGKDSKMEILNSSSTNAVGDLIEIKISLLQQQFTLKLSPNSTISELKSKVRKEGKIGTNKNLKVLYKGKLMSDERSTLNSLQITNGSVVHCAVSDVLSPQRAQQLRNSNLEQQGARGFDRLRFYGFSEAEVEQFRYEFHLHRSNDLNSSQVNGYDLEDEWINSEMVGAQEGNYSSIPNSPNSFNQLQEPRTRGHQRTLSNNNNNNNMNNNNSDETVIDMNNLRSSSPTSNLHHSQNDLNNVGGGIGVNMNGGNNAAIESAVYATQTRFQMDQQQHENDSETDVLSGILMGFFLGIIMLIWVQEDAMKMKTKLAVVFGITISVFFGVLRSWVFVEASP